MPSASDPGGSHHPDDPARRRLQQAGDKFHLTKNDHHDALEELKSAVVDADGGVSVADAADLTGVPGELLEIIQPDLGSETDPGRPEP